MSTITKRHQAIIDLLRQEGGRLSVRALSERLGVSAVTIRHDLRSLEAEHILERIYGGAILRARAPMMVELSFEVRQGEARKEKAALGRFAAQLVRDGYGIAMDGSTSVYALVPHLKQLNNLTIVTNSLMVAQSFRDTPRIKVLIPAGRIRGESATIVGEPDSLPHINLSLGFFGAWGVSLDGGISDVDPDEVVMRQAMIRRCMKTVIVIDSRKWGETAPYTYAQPRDVSRIISTNGASPEIVEQYRALGVEIDLVPVP